MLGLSVHPQELNLNSQDMSRLDLIQQDMHGDQGGGEIKSPGECFLGRVQVVITLKHVQYLGKLLTLETALTNRESSPGHGHVPAQGGYQGQEDYQDYYLL